MKKVIIGLIVLLIVAILGIGGAYAFMKLNLDPKKSFMQGMSEFVKASESLDLGPVTEIDKVSNESPIEVDTKVNIPIKNADLKDTLSEIGLESPIEISTKSVVDVVDFVSDESITVKTGKDNEFLNASLVLRNDAIGVKVEGVDDKYIALKNEDLKKFAKNMGIEDEDTLEMIPDRIPFDAFSKSEIDKVKEDFIQFITNTLNEYDKESYSIEKFNEDFGSDYGVKSGKKYTFTTTTKDVISKAKTYLNNFLDNDNLLSDVKDLIPDEVMKDIKKEIEDLGEDVKDKNIKIVLYKTSDGLFKFVVMDDSNNEYYCIIVDNVNTSYSQRISIPANYDKDGKIETPGLTSETVVKNDGSKVSVSSNISYNQNDVDTLISNRKNDASSWYNDDTDSYSSEFTFDTESEKEDEEEDSKSYYEELYKKMYKDRGYRFEISYEGKDGEYEGDISFDISDFISEDDFDEDEYKEIMDTIKGISISYSSKKVDKSDVVVLDDSNSKFVNDYEMDDFSKLLEDIVQNMKEYAENNKSSAISLINEYMNQSSSMDDLDNGDYENEEDDNFDESEDGEEDEDSEISFDESEDGEEDEDSDISFDEDDEEDEEE